MKALWNGTTLAKSNKTIVVEGNTYFPPDSINKEFFKNSNLKTTCAWKGIASYYNIEVDGKTNKEAAWYYPSTTKSAEPIRDYIAFWNGVEIKER